jgi:hypothetical protein
MAAKSVWIGHQIWVPALALEAMRLVPQSVGLARLAPSTALFLKSPLVSVEVLSPEANLSSSQKTKTTSFGSSTGSGRPGAWRT